MKNDNLEELFKTLDFDVAEPNENHGQRFESKLKQRAKRKTRSSGVISLWLPGLAIATSFLTAFLLFEGVFAAPFSQKQELASVSSEMETTQNFYASVIETELYKLKQQKSPETEKIVKDALDQLEILETDYEKLKTDLATSGQDQRVIYAMISNFQQRIALLNQVLERTKNINELKNPSHENNLL